MDLRPDRRQGRCGRVGLGGGHAALQGCGRRLDLARIVAELRPGVRAQLLEVLLNLGHSGGQRVQTVLAELDVLEVVDRRLEGIDVVQTAG